MSGPALSLVPLARQPLRVDFAGTPPIEIISLSGPPIAIEHLADQVEVVLNLAQRGPPGRDGTGSGTIVARTAGEAIGGHRAVAVDDDGLAFYASPSSPDLRVPSGVSIGAAVIDAEIDIQLSGSIDEPGWSWAAGPIYLAAMGVLTQAAPTGGAIVIVGFATGPTSMRIDPQLVALLN